MLVVCDGGSTKADWKIRYGDGGLAEFTTAGFNPTYHTPEQIAAIVGEGLRGKFDVGATGTVYYYGAGCRDSGRGQMVAGALAKVFNRAKIEVSHDMLAAARAACGDRPGIACILGTGSNSMLYDGKQEIDNVTNLGFLLGDEGSGSQIGKKLVQAYFYREMPAELRPLIGQVCPNGRKDILDQVYRKDGTPAAYLASFVRLFSGKFDHPFVRQLVRGCFLEFLARHVCKYENHQTLPVHFVGSVAFHCQDILQEALHEMGLHPGLVLQRPIGQLFEYHLKDENQ